ncbi:6209_t:CDS:2, partial [Gigaspora rosea]
EDANIQALTLIKSIIQNSKRPKEDTTVTSQQITEVTIVPLENKHSTIKTKQEDIYSSQWAATRDEMEDDGNISQTDLLQEILERLNHLEISQKEQSYPKHTIY